MQLIETFAVFLGFVTAAAFVYSKLFYKTAPAHNRKLRAILTLFQRLSVSEILSISYKTIQGASRSSPWVGQSQAVKNVSVIFPDVRRLVSFSVAFTIAAAMTSTLPSSIQNYLELAPISGVFDIVDFAHIAATAFFGFYLYFYFSKYLHPKPGTQPKPARFWRSTTDCIVYFFLLFIGYLSSVLISVRLSSLIFILPTLFFVFLIYRRNPLAHFTNFILFIVFTFVLVNLLILGHMGANIAAAYREGRVSLPIELPIFVLLTLGLSTNILLIFILGKTSEIKTWIALLTIASVHFVLFALTPHLSGFNPIGFYTTFLFIISAPLILSIFGFISDYMSVLSFQNATYWFVRKNSIISLLISSVIYLAILSVSLIACVGMIYVILRFFVDNFTSPFLNSVEKSRYFDALLPIRDVGIDEFISMTFYSIIDPARVLSDGYEESIISYRFFARGFIVSIACLPLVQFLIFTWLMIIKLLSNFKGQIRILHGILYKDFRESATESGQFERTGLFAATILTFSFLMIEFLRDFFVILYERSAQM